MFTILIFFLQGFGALPKYMGLKLTEDYTRADFGTQQIYEVITYSYIYIKALQIGFPRILKVKFFGFIPFS